MTNQRSLALSALLCLTLACGETRAASDASQIEIDGAAMMDHLRVLSADSMEGRAMGTPGGAKARAYVESVFQRLGLAAFEGGYRRPFPHDAGGQGVNVVGYVPGTVDPEAFVLVMAHYDHLGVRGGEIYNGADDNGSGTAGLLALAAYFVEHPPQRSLLFAALDGEELGLLGARHLASAPPIPLERIALVVNLDMVSNSAGELYAAGTYHYPFLAEHLDTIAEDAGVELLLGHDSPDLGSNDWSMSSDHGPFHQVGVPFVYFGVEDHRHYHRPTDTFETINPSFYLAAIETVRLALIRFDEHLPELIASSGREGFPDGPQ